MKRKLHGEGLIWRVVEEWRVWLYVIDAELGWLTRFSAIRKYMNLVQLLHILTYTLSSYSSDRFGWEETSPSKHPGTFRDADAQGYWADFVQCRHLLNHPRRQVPVRFLPISLRWSPSGTISCGISPFFFFLSNCICRTEFFTLLLILTTTALEISKW